MPVARTLFAVALAAFGATGALHAWSLATAPACKPGADWNEPAPPRQTHTDAGNVGTCGLTSLLLTGDRGHVLLDGASGRAAPPIEAHAYRRYGERSVVFLDERLAMERQRPASTLREN